MSKGRKQSVIYWMAFVAIGALMALTGAAPGLDLRAWAMPRPTRLTASVDPAYRPAYPELESPSLRDQGTEERSFPWYGVDLRDVEKYGSAPSGDQALAKVLVNAFLAYPQSFFSEGVVFTREGPGTPVRPKNDRRTKTLVDTVYGVEIQSGPARVDDYRVEYELTALFNLRQQFFFRRFAVTLAERPLSVLKIRILEDIPLSRTRFSLHVGLIERKAILVDQEHDIRKVYPLGVGSFDEGVAGGRGRTRLLTPLFRNGKIRRDTAIAARSTPDYFYGMPFLPITREDGTTTAVAFHIVQHAYEAKRGPDFNHMLRMFDSHGCMRLREMNLHELFAVVRNQARDSIPIQVAYEIGDPAEHPLAKIENRYQRVKNFGTPDDPRAEREGEPPLLVTQVVRKIPPIDLLPIEGGVPPRNDELEIASSGSYR